MPDIIAALANYALIIFIAIGVVAIVKLVLLVWFFYELVSLRKSSQKTAKGLSDLSKKISSLQPSPAVSSVPVGDDELIKYKNLLDAGAISEGEYEFKKTQILGRGETSYVDISSN